jgi:RNA polymerase sigma factor (sigma-70 family)
MASRLPSKVIDRMIKDLKGSDLDTGEVQNRLMELYRDTRSVEIYTLLYELSVKRFLSVVRSKLKRYGCLTDPQDILQDVFLSIYRYPRSFRAEHKNSFRNWSHSIIRNAIFKHLGKSRQLGPFFELDGEYPDDSKRSSPVKAAIRKENGNEARRIFTLSLFLYLHIYNTRLNVREKIALHKVEVENMTYKAAAASMQIKLENFKMVVCRARKKIFQHAAALSTEEPEPLAATA